MGWQIIKQPNNQYCVFSSVVDHLIMVNATEEELKDFYKEEYGRRGVEKVEQVLEKMNKGIPPYHQFTKSFDEMLETVKQVHGEFKVEFDNNYFMYESDFKK